jgi:uncharacterized protein (DUF433 family)
MRTEPTSMPRVSASVLAAIVTGAAAQPVLVVFVHDQIPDEIYRLADLNGDGDANDPGEATLFIDDADTVLGIDNAQGMVALDAHTLLATDNFAPDNVLLLTDTNGDGDALDTAESKVWFDGGLPGGFSLTNPADLTALPDGSYLLLDNNTLDTANPEAIYTLRDLNGDGDVSDAGEAGLFFELSPPGVSLATTFDVIRNAAGETFVFDITDDADIESIDIIDPAGSARTEWFDSVDLFSLFGAVLSATVGELEYLALTDEVVFGAGSLGGSQLILAARDINGSGRIDAASEIRVLWSESTSGLDTGSPRDLHFAGDGSLLWTDGLRDRVMRLVDTNGDGDYRDAGETTVFYDATGAAANVLPGLSLPLSVASAPLPSGCTIADLVEPFGQLTFADIGAFVSAFNSGSSVADLAEPFGQLTFADIGAFVAAFNAGCP